MEIEPFSIATTSHGGGVILSREERERHVWIVGKSGSGKSTFLFNLAMSDIMAGEGIAVIDPQQSRVIELRFFAGMSVEETAQALAISDRTVKRDWAMAKAWMQRELRRRVQGDSANSDGGTI